MAGDNVVESGGRSRCRTCLNAIRARYYQRHKEEIFARRRKKAADPPRRK